MNLIIRHIGDEAMNQVVAYGWSRYDIEKQTKVVPRFRRPWIIFFL